MLVRIATCSPVLDGFRKVGLVCMSKLGPKGAEATYGPNSSGKIPGECKGKLDLEIIAYSQLWQHRGSGSVLVDISDLAEAT